MEYEPTDEDDDFGFRYHEINEVYGNSSVRVNESYYEELEYSSHQKKSYRSTSILLTDNVKGERMNINIELIKLTTVGACVYESKIYSKIARLYIAKINESNRQPSYFLDYCKNIEITKIMKPIDYPVYDIKITDLFVSVHVRDIMQFLQHSLSSPTDEKIKIIKKITNCTDHVDKDDIFGLYTKNVFVNFKKEKPSLRKLASQVICFRNSWFNKKNSWQAVDKLLYDIKRCGLGLLNFCMYDSFEIQAEYETIYFDKPMTMLECLNLELEIIEKYDYLERKHHEKNYNGCKFIIGIINKNIKASDLDMVSCVLENASIFDFTCEAPRLISDFSVDTFHNVAFMSWKIGDSAIIVKYYEDLMDYHIYWKNKIAKNIKRSNRFDRKIKKNVCMYRYYRRNYSPGWHSEMIEKKEKDNRHIITKEIDDCYAL
jgi:hypothetical protein